MSSSDLYTCNW